jgi:hypothetical protein
VARFGVVGPKRATARWYLPREQGAEAAAGQPLGVLSRLVVDVGGGDRRVFALGCVAIRDAVDELPLPWSQESPVVVA